MKRHLQEILIFKILKTLSLNNSLNKYSFSVTWMCNKRSYNYQFRKIQQTLNQIRLQQTRKPYRTLHERKAENRTQEAQYTVAAQADVPCVMEGNRPPDRYDYWAKKTAALELSNSTTSRSHERNTPGMGFSNSANGQRALTAQRPCSCAGPI